MWITHSLKNSNTNKLDSSYLNSFLNLTYKLFKENYDLRPFDYYHYVEFSYFHMISDIKSSYSVRVWSNRLFCSRSNEHFKLIGFPYFFKLYHSKLLIFLQWLLVRYLQHCMIMFIHCTFCLSQRERIRHFWINFAGINVIKE